jgi:hypothetical protein
VYGNVGLRDSRPADPAALALGAAAALLVAALFAPWERPRLAVFFGALDRVQEEFDRVYRDGWAALTGVDVAIAMLAVLLAALAVAPPLRTRGVRLVAAVVVVGVVAGVAVQGLGGSPPVQDPRPDSASEVRGTSVAWEGVVLTGLALALAVAGLAGARRDRPAPRLPGRAAASLAVSGVALVVALALGWEDFGGLGLILDGWAVLDWADVPLAVGGVVLAAAAFVPPRRALAIVPLVLAAAAALDGPFDGEAIQAGLVVAVVALAAAFAASLVRHR